MDDTYDQLTDGGWPELLDRAGDRPWKWVTHWARETPDRPAVSDGQTTWTYERLWSEVQRWSGRFGEFTARCRVIALSAPKSPALLAAMLGVMRSGNTALVLDPAETVTRLERVLAEAEPVLVLADDLDEMRQSWPDAEAFDAGDPVGEAADDISGSELAWVVYTSGSTGVPKGMARSHAVLAQRAAMAVERTEMTSDDVSALFYDLSFVASGRVVFPSLLIGAELRLVHARSTSLASIIATIADHGVTQLLAPPQMIKAVVGQCQTDDPRLRTVRHVRLSADRTQPADLRAALRCLPPHCVVVISYGAGETGAISENEFRRGDEVPPGRIPVGQPRKWIEVRITDEYGAPVQPGEVGMVEVRGRLLMPEPFPRTGVVHHRWIRNGDLARILEDGSLDLVGRANARVKIDGVAVDLNEVEDALASHPDVESVVCVRGEDAQARAEIVAFVVAARPIGLAELREQANRLPPNARPGAYRRLDRLPVTSRGKVDREALREMVTCR